MAKSTILLYELTCSGGLWAVQDDLAEADSLIREGRAMLTALAADFAAIDGVETMVMRDERWSQLEFVGCKILNVSSRQDEESFLRQYSSHQAAAVVIAPESDGLLEQRCRWVEKSGRKLIGPSTEIVNLATDKQRTAEHLRQHGVAAPRGVLLHPDDPWPSAFQYPAVIKPVDGCGSLDVRLVERDSGHSHSACSQKERIVPMRLEEFVPGITASVAVLCGPQELRPLPPCRQRLTNDGRFCYLGGSLPLPPDLAQRAQRLAVRGVATLPQPRGYIGVDLVLGDDPAGSGDAVIEINPRLTTSYIGLRAAAQGNLAAAMWAIADGRPADISFRSEPLEFDSDGTIR